MTEYNADSEDDLENQLQIRLRNTGETIPADPISENEFKRLENKLSAGRERLAALEKTRQDYALDVHGDRREANLLFSELPRNIAGCEKDLAGAKAGLKETNRNIRAHIIASEIFSSLSEDNDQMLTSLAEEIKKVFSLFSSEREVELKNFSMKKENVSAADEGGALRSLENLSAGTRDSFLLAARLTLAHKTQTGNKDVPVIFDESFAALDRNRTNRALKALEEFKEKTGRQLIIFTKDFDMETEARRVFGDNLAVHRLGS
jgi:uncharacterized protein YhaN